MLGSMIKLSLQLKQIKSFALLIPLIAVLFPTNYLLADGSTPKKEKNRSMKKSTSGVVIPSEKKRMVRVQEEPNEGWSYLIQLLVRSGFPEASLLGVYADKRMPAYTRIPFHPNPKESKALYSRVINKRKISAGLEFMVAEKRNLQAAERQYLVPAGVIAAILLVESEFGKNTGRELVVYKLSRLVALSEPANIKWNFDRLRPTDRDLTIERLQQRALFLKRTFLPELEAFFQQTLIGAEKSNIRLGSPFSIYGSSAGAIGLPQFLPGSILRLGVDADRDGKVDLFKRTDSIFSVGNFLRSSGWRPGLSYEQKLQVLLSYNNSRPYGETVLNLAKIFGDNQ